MEDEPSFLAGFVSESGMYDPIEVWGEFLAEMQTIPALLLKEQIIAKAKRVIEEGRERSAQSVTGSADCTDLDGTSAKGFSVYLYVVLDVAV